MAKMQIPAADFKFEPTRGNLKAAMAEAKATNPHALWQVPIDKIRRIPGFNVRIRTPEYLEHIQFLKRSITENGFYQDKPLSGYVAVEDGDNVIYVTDGYSRLEGAELAVQEGYPLETLPVVIKPKGTSEEDLTVAMFTSNEGRQLTPMEKAILVKRLINAGIDEATIAKRLSITTKYINDLMTLIEAPKPVRDLVTAGKITGTLAIQELSKHGAKATERLKAAVEKAEGQGKTRATAKHVEKAPAKKAAKKTTAKKGKAAPSAESTREIDAKDVIADAVASGLDGREATDPRLLTFAATLLARFDIDVTQDVEDPAADL